jgi:hypothetical protein
MKYQTNIGHPRSHMSNGAGCKCDCRVRLHALPPSGGFDGHVGTLRGAPA